MAMISFCFLPQRAVLSISGKERKSFLQGLIANNVEKVSASSVIHTALLTPQGKFLYEFFIVEVGESLLLETESDRLEDLKSHLARFQLRAQIILTMENDMVVAVAFGEGVAAALNLMTTAPVRRMAGRSVAYIDPRRPEVGIRLVGEQEILVRILHSINSNEVSETDYDRLRLKNGLPDGSRDLVVGRSGLLEYGFEELNGVDFSKGCYVGQEVVSRSKYRGLVKKRLVPVSIDGPVPTPGTPLLFGQREAGEMRSAVEGIGLALLRLESLVQSQRACQSFRAGTTHLTPCLPAWLVLPDLSKGRRQVI
ncbi:Folate-dependent protein for Fe/S cluster synthesis/repair in oxidative stress [invertebrate metagenome]|uniref:Folate-dependent protein for Fe/S cluster synthesis/repair in oxidative stress n=1 Tax=invertebrate metagenome TaxID=1711999 RepID=A0A484H9R3_9ZZZZ